MRIATGKDDDNTANPTGTFKVRASPTQMNGPFVYSVSSLQDVRAPKLSIVWQEKLEMPFYELPDKARLFTAERWEGTPLVAGTQIVLPRSQYFVTLRYTAQRGCYSVQKPS